jgi:hypothetical protein
VTAAGAPVPTVDELVVRAAALRPLLQANEEQGDRERRLAEENVRATASCWSASSPTSPS